LALRGSAAAARQAHFALGSFLIAPKLSLPMRIEIINTGSELLLGRVLNTHQQWLCRQLADLGYTVDRQVAVDDMAPNMLGAVREALAVADLVIVTGGLGPTSDDRTREVIAEFLGRKLHEDAAVLAHIQNMFATRKRPMPASTRVQAMVPEGATVLMNAHGTAPGLVLEAQPMNPKEVGQASSLPPGLPAPDPIAGRMPAQAGWKPALLSGPSAPRLLVMLPGPPRELRPMFTGQVVPILRQRLPLPAPFVCRTLRTTGLGESMVEERIAGPLQPLTQAGLELGYCARVGEVDVRFTARGEKARDLVAEGERIARSLLGELVFAVDDEWLDAAIIRLLTERKQTLVLAESCTGGFIAHRLTNVPGASAVLLAGLVTYSNEAKQRFLGVRPDTLSVHGAVSEAVAREMAEGARARAGADYAIAVTGIAGPGGGTEEKPVGTVWLALADAGGTIAQRKFNAFDRETFKYVTAQQALDRLRLHLAFPG
jgi:nicotinamide-nucleotide amidase